MGRTHLEAVTHNVSRSGLFVRCDVTGTLRQLVLLETDLPFGLGALEAHGMVVHVVPPGVGGAPGMGLALYGLDHVRRKQWDSFIDEVQRRVPQSRSSALVAYRVDAAPPEPIRRRFERFDVVLEVQVELVDELVTMYTRDISRGGMLLQTEFPLRVDDGFVLRVVHPRTRDSLNVPCVVRRVVDDLGFRGVGVEFLDLDDQARAIFWAFIGAEIDTLDDDEVIIVDESR